MSSELATLRAELKIWEKQFKAENERAATPDDIRLIPGLAEKYKRFKLLSKGKTKAEPATATTNTSKPSIVHRSKAEENDKDPLPASARPNPFSPVKKRVHATIPNDVPPIFAPSVNAFPNLFTTPVKKKRNSEIISPSVSPNPFIVQPLPQDSPFTLARKRLRGEEVKDNQPPDKKRRFTARSQSTSLFSAWSQGKQPDYANILAHDQSDDIVMEESPIKGSAMTIFNDPPPVPSSSRENLFRSISLPSASLFGKRLEATQSADVPEEVPLITPQTLQLDEGQKKNATMLLPPSPNGGRTIKHRIFAKGKGKSRKEENVEDEEELEDDEPSILEVDWKISGPLVRSESKGTAMDDEEMQDADDERFQFDPTLTSRFHLPVEEDIEEGRFEVNIPDEMRTILQLSPSKSKKDEEAIVRDLLSGHGDRSKHPEVWTAGDFEEGYDSEEWASEEGPGWWEAEL